MLVTLSVPQNIQATRELQVHSRVRLPLALADTEELKQAMVLYYKTSTKHLAAF